MKLITSVEGFGSLVDTSTLNVLPSRMDKSQIDSRFETSVSGEVPNLDQKDASSSLRHFIMQAAYEVNTSAADGRLKSLALTELESALMWGNKAIFQDSTMPTPARPIADQPQA